MNSLRRVLLLIVVLGLAACDQANILSPADNAVSPNKPASFDIGFTGSSAPADLNIQLNTVDVTGKFTVTDTGASADGAKLAEHVLPGRNVFQVTAYQQVKQAYFYYDTGGPAVHILDTDRATRTVTGYLSDPGGIASVTLDGVPVDLQPNNHFTTSYQDLPFNVFEATDGFGHAGITKFARNDRTFTGLSAYLSQGGLDFVAPVLEEALSGTDLRPLLATMGPITIDMPAFGLSLDVEITNLYMNNLDLGLGLQPSELMQVDFYTEDLIVDLRLSNIRFVLDPLGLLRGLSVAAKVTTTDDRSGNNYLDVSTLLGLSVINRDIDLSTNNTDLAVSNLHIEPVLTGIKAVDGLIGDVVSLLLNVILDLFSDLILFLADHLIVPLVSEFLSEVGIGVTLQDLDGKGSDIAFNATPDYLQTTAAGLSVRLATNAKAPNPAAYVPTSLGSLFVDGEAPVMPTTTPDGSSFDFGVALSANVLNQILVAAHDSGLTTINLGPGFYPLPGDTSVLNPSILSGDLIGIRILPASAPYVTLGTAKGAAGTLHWYDLTVALDLYREEWGEYRTIFGATLNVEVPFEVNSTYDGNLGLVIEQMPLIDITGTEASGLLPIPASFINSTVQFVMPVVLPIIANQLQVIPLPSIFEHTLFMEQFWVVGGEGNNTLAIAGKLIPRSLTLAADDPTTNIDAVDYKQSTIELQSEVNGTIITEILTLNNGEVTISISGNNPNPEYGELQYRYRVDGAGWSGWKERSEVTVTNLLTGDHSVEICARSALMREEANCPVVSFTTSNAL